MRSRSIARNASPSRAARGAARSSRASSRRSLVGPARRARRRSRRWSRRGARARSRGGLAEDLARRSRRDRRSKSRRRSAGCRAGGRIRRRGRPSEFDETHVATRSFPRAATKIEQTAKQSRGTGGRARPPARPVPARDAPSRRRGAATRPLRLRRPACSRRSSTLDVLRRPDPGHPAAPPGGQRRGARRRLCRGPRGGGRQLQRGPNQGGVGRVGRVLDDAEARSKDGG